MPGRFTLLLLNGAILTVCAVFVDIERKLLLTSLLLMLPLLDQHCRQTNVSFNKQTFSHWLLISCIITLLLIANPEQLGSFTKLLLFVALPEEWFFRRYIQSTLFDYFSHRKISFKFPLSLLSILSTSLLFTLMHLPTQGYIGLSVFLPSLLLGYVYQLKQDLIFVILLHSLFNLFFIIYLQHFLQYI